MLTPQKQQYLEEVFGKDEAAKIVGDLNGAGEALKEMGVAYKDFASASANEPDAAADEGSPEAYKTLIGMAFEGHGETVKVVQAMQKAHDAAAAAWKAEREKLEARLKAVEKALASPASAASAASTSDATVIEGDKADAAAAEIEKKQTGKENPYAEVLPGLFSQAAAE